MVSSGGLEGAISGGDGADIGGNTVANNDADDGDDGGDGSDAAADRDTPLITRHTRCWSRFVTGHARTGAETGGNRPSRRLSVRRRWVGAGIYAIS